MKILLMGHQKWACMVIEKLLEDGHEIVAVITETDSFDSSGDYEKFAPYGCYDSLKKTAEKHNLPVMQPKDVHQLNVLEKIWTLNPDLIVVVSYHAILKEPLIGNYTIINAHGALLPKYRGRAPINWAIINGETETGVTVHFIDKGIDTGDIILQEMVEINQNDTAIEVLKKTLPLYPKLVSTAVMQIEEGYVQRKKQDLSKGSYFPKRRPEDGVIDWNKTTRDVYNWTRALTKPYPGAFTFVNCKKLFVWNAELPQSAVKQKEPPGTVVSRSENSISVATSDSFIVLTSIEFENGKKDSFKDFEKGSVFDLKQPIRYKFLSFRNSLKEEEFMKNSSLIIENLKSLVLFHDSKNINCYVSKEKEVFTHDLIKLIINEKGKVIVPFMDQGINSSELAKFEDLKKGTYGVLEPQNINPFEKKAIDLIIVPGIAFDLSGNRIGYGKGFYDLFLKNIKAKKVALAYDFQVVDKLPSAECDIKMDYVVTETRILRCKNE